MYPIKANKLKVTSKYGNRTYIYRGEETSDFHTGIDLIANPKNKNAEIIAFDEGIVTKVQKTGEQYGKACYIRIKHNNGWSSLYYHLKTNSIVVNVGDKVVKGQKLGIIGTTGMSTGIHLHFQIDKGTNTTTINPYDYVFKDKELDNNKTSTNNVDNNKQVTYSKGNYKTLANMYVRTGAGTNYSIKKVSQLTADGKRNATSSNKNANAIYKKGTIFTAREIINQNGIWAKTPSGYVCIKGKSGTIYCKKI